MDKTKHNIIVAVIMSIYKNDRLDFVKESVESILNQTYKHFDLYIIFDGPIQEEVNIYLKNIDDNRINIIERKDNRGLAYSLNELLKIVLVKNYLFIARMDADDISKNDRFEKQLAFLNKHLETDCVGSWAVEISEDGSEYFKKKMPLTHEACLDMFKKRDCMIHPTVMFRQSYFKKAGLYPEDTFFGEDTMMWAKGFVNNCYFANIPEYLLKFRIDNNFFNRRRGWKHAKSIWQLRNRVNRMLGFGAKEYVYSTLYAVVKIMPKSIINILYQTIR